jgi:glycosyltransferase involved in cell wall biosynthesis
MLYREAACSGPALLKCLRCASEPYGPAKAIAAVAGVFSGKALLLSKAMATHSITSYVREVTQRDLIGRRTRGQKPGEDTIPDFVIPSFLAPPREDAQLSSDWLPSEPYILFVGALQSHKGIHQLLSAYESLQDRPPLVLVGTRWPETPARFPDGVLVRQDVPHDQVMTAFDRCLFAVVPSIWPEPLGVVSLEAMSRGKAVVASAVGGITGL